MPLKSTEKTIITADTTDSVSWLQKPTQEARFSCLLVAATFFATAASCFSPSLPPEAASLALALAQTESVRERERRLEAAHRRS